MTAEKFEFDGREKVEIKYKRKQKQNRVFFILLLCMIVAIIVLSILFYNSRRENRTLSQTLKGDTSRTSLPTTLQPTTPRTTTAPPDGAPYADIRLPKHIEPLHYKIDLKTDLDFKVTGSSITRVKVTSPTKYVIIHAVGFESLTSIVKRSSHKFTVLKQANAFFYNKNDYYVIELEKEVKANEQLHIDFEFSYMLKEDLQGFYKSPLNDNRYVASTQLAPVNARRVFPCFDEPAMKATFDLSLTHHKDTVAIANMPVLHKKTNGEWKTEVFFSTKPMSTYLLAFAILPSEYGVITSSTTEFNSSNIHCNQTITHPVKMNFHAPKDQLKHLNLTVDVATKVLPFLETYHCYPYVFNQTGLLAVPQLSYGAMENWGLIIFRQEYLIYDPAQSNIDSKYKIAAIVAHELVHQWFGNLVTMEWWSQIWLNEGFASYMEYVALNAIYPTWNAYDLQIIYDRQPAFALDTLPSSHPIVADVKDPNKINEMFDLISYQKGGYVLRMVNKFLGDDAFRNGIKMYIKNNEFKAATTKNLWDTLQKASNSSALPRNLSDIMNTWTVQKNFPLVTVIRKESGVTLQQKRFMPDVQNTLNEPKSNPYWDIPFHYAVYKRTGDTWTLKKTDFVWMNESIVEVELADDEIMKGNHEEDGYYMVHYQHDWKKIAELLEQSASVVSSKDRAGLILNVFSLADSGYVEYTTALDILLKHYNLGEENDYLVWLAIKEAVSSLRSLLDQQTKNKFHASFMEKLSSVYNKHKFNPTTGFVNRSHQALMVELACGVGHSDCIIEAHNIFQDWMVNDTQISADFKRTVLIEGVKRGGKEAWEFVLSSYMKTNTPTDKKLMLEALAATPDKLLKYKYLLSALNTSYIAYQHFGDVVWHVAKSGEFGQFLAWTFIKENHAVIMERYKEFYSVMKRVYGYTLSSMATQLYYDDVKSYVDKHREFGQGNAVLNQTLDRIRLNIAWRSRNGRVFEQWFPR